MWRRLLKLLLLLLLRCYCRYWLSFWGVKREESFWSSFFDSVTRSNLPHGLSVISQEVSVTDTMTEKCDFPEVVWYQTMRDGGNDQRTKESCKKRGKSLFSINSFYSGVVPVSPILNSPRHQYCFDVTQRLLLARKWTIPHTFICM